MKIKRQMPKVNRIRAIEISMNHNCVSREIAKRYTDFELKLNKELMCEPVMENQADPDGEFGYTPRYAEYKFHANEIHGDFRDTLRFNKLSSTRAYLRRFRRYNATLRGALKRT